MKRPRGRGLSGPRCRASVLSPSEWTHHPPGTFLTCLTGNGFYLFNNQIAPLSLKCPEFLLLPYVGMIVGITGQVTELSHQSPSFPLRSQSLPSNQMAGL